MQLKWLNIPRAIQLVSLKAELVRGKTSLTGKHLAWFVSPTFDLLTPRKLLRSCFNAETSEARTQGHSISAVILKLILRVSERII